jgi:ABC-type transporter Mla subunit MlaD
MSDIEGLIDRLNVNNTEADKFAEELIKINDGLEETLKTLESVNNANLDNAIDSIKKVIEIINQEIQKHNTRVINTRNKIDSEVVDLEQSFREKLAGVFNEQGSGEQTAKQVAGAKKKTLVSTSDSEGSAGSGDSFGRRGEEFSFYFSGGEYESDSEESEE